MHTVIFNKIQTELPRTISSALMDYSVTFLETGTDTGGAYTLVEVEMQPNSGNELHYHTAFTETFEVLEGTLGLQVDDQQIALQPGNPLTAPQYSKHRFYNDSPTETVKFLVTVAPAGQFEQMLRTAYGLANDGKTNAKGIPGLWHAALLFSMGDTYMTGLPLWLQRYLFGGLARISRALGKDKELEHYYKTK